MPEGIEKNPAPCRTPGGQESRQSDYAGFAQIRPSDTSGYSRTSYRHNPRSRTGDYRWHPRLSLWTDDRQIHIHTILHQNKNDENARGHIGTELNNKAETVMQVEVDKMDRTVSVVEAIHIRDREFEPFAFRINDEVLPELLDSYHPQEKKIGRPAKEPFDPYKEISESVHRAALDAAFTNVCITSYDDYLERLKEGYALQDIKLGHNKAVKVATFLSNKRIVIKEGKEYKINPDSYY